MRASLFVALAATAAPVLPVLAQQPAGRPLTFQDFAAVRAVSDPQIAPDGRSVLYTVRTTDVDANRRTARTFVLPANGGTPRAFPADSVSATEARWSPDGNRVAYIAHGQLWVANADGSAARQLTTLNGGATGPVWSPDGAAVAFTSAVYPACMTAAEFTAAMNACNEREDSTRGANKVKAHIADQLMFRHWNAWDEGTRSHLFTVRVADGGVRDLTHLVKYDVPPGPFGGSEAYAWAPNGSELTYSAKDQGRADAWSTNVDLYTVSTAGDAPQIITRANMGADQNPVYSPDGRYIAYASQRRAGFESDRWRLMLYDRQAHTARELLPRWDRNADAYWFAPDMSAIYVQTIDRGREKLYRFALTNGNAGAVATVIGQSNNAGFTFSRDGKSVAWVRDAANHPAEVYIGSLVESTSPPRQLSHENDTAIAQLALNPAEEMWFHGAGGDSVQAFIIKPPQYQPGHRYPVVLLIHGGPQGAWLDQWHSRWNYQMFAAPGFGLVIINPRGSFGYGQRFTDEISRDWGGKVYTDLMRGLDTALARYSWMDRTKLGAAGGSYGGYMVNWIAGHSRRFSALVTHAGPFNLENMSVATEELWFPEWEYGGDMWNATAMRTNYRRWSPHLFAGNFRTPTLVTGGELDFRVPYTEDISMFTALQRQGVPSRLVLFPDEGHWIGKPQNARLWWGEVQGWLSKYLLTQPRT